MVQELHTWWWWSFLLLPSVSSQSSSKDAIKVAEGGKRKAAEFPPPSLSASIRSSILPPVTLAHPHIILPHLKIAEDGIDLGLHHWHMESRCCWEDQSVWLRITLLVVTQRATMLCFGMYGGVEEICVLFYSNIFNQFLICFFQLYSLHICKVQRRWCCLVDHLT